MIPAIPALLAQIGLPLLVKAVGGALGGLDHPVAKGAAEALAAVDEAVSRRDITPEQVAEANRHTERMSALAAGLDRTALRQINATFRAELATEDPYVRRWRPTFGYAVALAWLATMAACAWAVVSTPAQAPAIIAALVNTSPIWAVALGVLGVSVVKRSQDKQGRPG
jgi:hypothetical protein